jgi:hypothetical protein
MDLWIMPPTPNLYHQKLPKNHQVDNAEPDETGFGGFVTMPPGIFVESIVTKPKIIQCHFRI